MSNRFKNKIIEKHFWSLQTVNWLIRSLYNQIQYSDKKTILNPKLYPMFGFNTDKKHTVWELYDRSNYYKLLLEVGLLGLSKIIEGFFREYLTTELLTEKLSDKPKTFFQNIDNVHTILKKLKFDFSQNMDFQKIRKCMEIRHIYQHNDGIVDGKFKIKIQTQLKIGEIYQLSDKEISDFSQSYENILRKFDK